MSISEKRKVIRIENGKRKKRKEETHAQIYNNIKKRGS
jgi:hypothetical protein